MLQQGGRRLLAIDNRTCPSAPTPQTLWKTCTRFPYCLGVTVLATRVIGAPSRTEKAGAKWSRMQKILHSWLFCLANKLCRASFSSQVTWPNEQVPNSKPPSLRLPLCVVTHGPRLDHQKEAQQLCWERLTLHYCIVQGTSSRSTGNCDLTRDW